MTIYGTNIEKVCKYLLQKEISIDIKDKTFKKGRLLLFYQRNFYLTFVMDTAKKLKEKVEIPIPYGVELHEKENLVYFDYRVKTLAKHAPEIEMNLVVYPKKITGNKFWDSIILINANANDETDI
jgi:hypothetical protein